jgi:hypothetical protein
VIEDELRTMFTSRSDEVPDNPTRVAQVHGRIGGIRRRRAAATTLALVLIVAAGVLFTRLPGKPQTLPTGSPAGPYFGDSGSDNVPGYRGQQFFTFTGDAAWSATVLDTADVVVVARCDRPGDLTLRNVSSSDERRLSCRVPVGDHFEGALPVENNRDHGLLATTPSGANVTVRPGSTGSWTVGLLEPLYPAHLTEPELKSALLSGYDGRRLTLTVPGNLAETHALVLAIVCVREVRLEFMVSGRTLATVACTDEANPAPIGQVTVLVPDGALAALGLRPLEKVTVDVRSTGRQTDEWAVIAVG